MKKIGLSVIAALSLGSFALAGGDLAPAPVMEPDNSGIYFGIGYSYLKTDYNTAYYDGGQHFDDDNGEYSSNAGLFVLGYQYNQYLAFEGRYTYKFDKFESHTNNESGEYTLSNLGLYLKPQYSIGDFSLYALVGYGWTMVEEEDDELDIDETKGGFQWGVGAAYALSEHTSVFVDYTQLADSDELKYLDNGDGWIDKFEDLYTINVGMTYKF